MCKNKTLIFIALFILFFTCINQAYSAYQPRVNISIWEIVYKNTTFAENFDLTESVKMFTIVGYINISNPSSDGIAVNNINVRFSNLTNIISNFSNISGRPGRQSVFWKYSNDSSELGEINATNLALPFDIDEDGNADYISLNSTHLLINCSTENIIIPLRLRNQTNNLNLANSSQESYCLNFTDNIISYKDIMNVYANVSVFGCTGNDGNNKNDSINSTTQVLFTDKSRPYAIIFIPELRAGDYTLFNYTISTTSVDDPMNVTTQYTHAQLTKVLSGEFFNITDTITNDGDIQFNMTDINITLETLPVIWNGTQDTFVFSYLWNSTLCGQSTEVCASINDSDFANVVNESNMTWHWQASSGNLGYNDSRNISYQVKAPLYVPSTGTYNAVRMTLRYRLNHTVSNISVSGVNASAQVVFNFTKRLAWPQDMLGNHNVTWEVVPEIFTNLSVNFTVYQASLWITDNLNPNNVSQGFNFEKNYTEIPLITINESKSWIGSRWMFNYTDGYSDSFPPPIVWMKPTHFITNDNRQIWNQTYTVNGTNVYIKYIYVIYGYWLEVYKNITNIGEGKYNITILVHNKGNGWTPNSSIITVYDFIPSTFTKSATRFNSTPRFADSETVQTVTNSLFSGQAIKWDIGFLPGERSSCFSPRMNNLAQEGANDSWFVYYEVNGTGDYVVSDLYVVGLDPRQVDGAFASPFISVLSGISSNSMELVFVIIVVVLLALNVSNFIMTRRINQKLVERQNVSELKNELDDLKKKLK